MGHSLRIGRLFGIDIAIHPSWFVILFVFVWSLGASFFPAQYHWSTATDWTVAVIATLLLFASVVAHELAHSLTARAQGLTVKGITLFLLGGLSTFDEEASSPGREAVMAGVGPLTSAVIGAGALALGQLAIWPQTVGAVLLYLGSVNLLLAVFNLLPGFPLDGGRVLRALLWAISHDRDKATRRAARVGLVMGWVLVALGVLLAFSANTAGGLWTAFIGWTLVQAAHMTSLQAYASQRLDGVTVGRLMLSLEGWVPGDVTLRRAASEYFLAGASSCLPVEDENGTFEGLVCLADLEHEDRRRWGIEQVRDVMTPVERLHSVAPETPASEALRLLQAEPRRRLTVVDTEGHILGVVDPAALARYLATATTPHSGAVAGA